MVEERIRQILEGQQIIAEQAEQIRRLDNLLDEADLRWKEQLDEVVRQRLADFDLNIADLADEMHLSRTQFFRKIKSVTGMTPNQYLQEARLSEAKSLLEARRYDSVKAVSYCVGFKQAGYFARIFKEKYGFSPAGYFGEN
jgi:AraC-like DNA-binding protein